MDPSDAVRAAMARPSCFAKARSSDIIRRSRPRRRCEVRTVTAVTSWVSNVRPNPMFSVLRNVPKVATGTSARNEPGATAPVW